MRPLLADVELPQVQQIRTRDLRALAEHKPPGKDGSLLQDLGRAPTTMTVWGMASDPGARALLEHLKGQVRSGEPVPFLADVAATLDVEDVVVDDLQIRQLAGKPDRFAYLLTLREFVEPVEPEDASALDVDVLGDARDLLDGLVDGLDLAAAFASGLEGFVAPLGDFVERLGQFRRDLDEARTP